MNEAGAALRVFVRVVLLFLGDYSGTFVVGKKESKTEHQKKDD